MSDDLLVKEYSLVTLTDNVSIDDVNNSFKELVTEDLKGELLEWEFKILHLHKMQVHPVEVEGQQRLKFVCKAAFKRKPPSRDTFYCDIYSPVSLTEKEADYLIEKLKECLEYEVEKMHTKVISCEVSREQW